MDKTIFPQQCVSDITDVTKDLAWQKPNKAVRCDWFCTSWSSLILTDVMEVPKHFSLGRPAGILVDGDVEIALYFLSVHMVTWHKNKARKSIPF